MSFPLSPTDGQLAVLNGINYSYSTSTQAWTRVAQVISTSFNGGYVSGTTQFTNTTASTSTTTGAVTVAGGVGIQGDLYARNIYMNGVLVGTGGGGNAFPYIDMGFIYDIPVAGSVDAGPLP